MQGYMPVFMQAAEAPAPQPSVLQPAPVDPAVKKLKDVKANVDKYLKRVKCTSFTLILIGVIGMCASLYHSFNAKHHAMMKINFPKHHHGPPPPRPEELESMAPKYVSRDEFDLYDSIKTMSMITFFIFGKIFAIGKCGKWIIWRNRSSVTKRVLKKSCLGFVLIFIMSLWAMKEKQHMKSIVKRHRHEQAPLEWPPMEDDAKFSVDGNRHLEEITEAHEEDTCNVLADEGSCNAKDFCSWCKAAAVKSACHSIDNARKLPPAVFGCSKLEAEEPVKQKKPFEELKPIEVKKPVNPLKHDEQSCGSLGFGSESKCNAYSDCTWCYASCPGCSSGCHSIDYAKGLPPYTFACSKVHVEEPVEEKKPVEVVKPVEVKKPVNPLKDDEATCSALSNEGACNANSVCSWCNAAAVRPACHSIENAKTLPPAVFDCSKVDAEEPVQPQMPKELEEGLKMMDKMIEQAESRFKQFQHKIPQIFKDDEDTCNAHKDDTSCNAQSDICSWCISAAVKPACHSIANAKTLPSAVFQCSNVDKYDFYMQDMEDFEDEEEPEEEPAFFQQFMDKMRGGRKHRRGPPQEDEEDEERFGRRGHHGGRHGGKKHHRKPRVNSDDDFEDDSGPVIIAGTPVKADVAKKFYRGQSEEEEQGPRGSHGKHGKHGKHGCAKGCRIVKLAMALFIGAHFWFIKSLKSAQESVEAITGKKDDGWGKCGWKKKKAAQVAQVVTQPVQQQPVYFQQPIVEYSVNSESSLIHEEGDKEMGFTYAPTPTTSTITVNNQMV